MGLHQGGLVVHGRRRRKVIGGATVGGREVSGVRERERMGEEERKVLKKLFKKL